MNHPLSECHAYIQTAILCYQSTVKIVELVCGGRHFVLSRAEIDREKNPRSMIDGAAEK